MTVIGTMLGHPPEDSGQLKRWSDELADQIAPTASLATRARAGKAAAALRHYLEPVVEERRKHPGDDILSGLIHAEKAGDRLTTEELYANLTLLLITGRETTTNLIGNGLLALLQHPEQLDLLRREPDRIRNAVEEVLRYDSPVQRNSRVGVVNLEVGDVTIPAGAVVRLELGAANHDPAHFDHPERLDITRAENRHLSFSQGPHYCLGASLARMEGQIAISKIITRFPHLRLTGEELRWRPNSTLRGFEALPVSFQ